MLGLALASTALPAAPAQPASWKPTRPVEIVVGVSPGGGIDRMARVIQKIVQEDRLVQVPVNVVNKPGGGGAIAQAYLQQHAGDAHYIHITATALLTNHIIGKSQSGYRDFTPLVMLTDEYIGFLVREDSALRTGRHLLHALRNDPESLPIGIATAAGNTNHIAAALLARAAGGDVKKLKVVVFGSGGESITELLGGHVGLVATPSANAIPHVQAGRMRVLGIAAPQRLEGPLAAVPTWNEQGVNVVVANWRPVIGPKGLTGQQIAFWEAAFAKLEQDAQWQSAIAHDGSVAHYLNSRDLASYFDAQYAQFRSVLAELGLAR